MKRFFEWIGVKRKLDAGIHSPPFVSERDIWWASVGENVGFEINGKSDLFTRPVIIFKKLSRGLYLVVPTTTQMKEGTWYVTFTHHSKSMSACLHQVRVIDYRRLSSPMGKIDPNGFARIQKGFRDLYDL